MPPKKPAGPSRPGSIGGAAARPSMRPPAAPKKPPTKKAANKKAPPKKSPPKKTPPAAQQTVDPQHDCGPWIEVTKSSRLTRFRYDYGTGDLQVTWRNGRGHVHTTYHVDNVPNAATGKTSKGDEVYRQFATAASKGRRVNTHLNGFGYHASTPDELDAPSSPKRKAVKTVDKGSGYAGWNEDGSARMG